MMLYRKIVASVLTIVILAGPVAAGPQSSTVFKKVDFYTQEGGKMRDYDAQIIIDPRLRSIKFAHENNASRTFAFIEWDRITGVTYENTKHARITAGLLVTWPLLFLKGKKHWLTITFGPGPNNAPGGYVYARMDKDNYRNILAAINGLTGREIRRIEEGGETGTLYPGVVTQVQPVAPPQQRQVQVVVPAQPRTAVGNSTYTAPSRPGDTISAGALPPIPPTWTPPEKLAHSATWTTRDADGVRYQMSATVANHNDVAMRAVAAVVLHEATGGALYTTRVGFIVPPNATHEEKGTGTVPNEAATRGDYWSIDIEWDPGSLPESTTPTTPKAPVSAEAPGLNGPVLPSPVLPEYFAISSVLEGTWRSGRKTMEITRVPRDEDRISFTPDGLRKLRDNRYFFAAISGGGQHLENYRFEDTSLAVVRDAGFTFPGGILLRWRCQEQNAVTSVYGAPENNAVQFQNGASLTLMSNDQIRVQSTIPVFISTPGYSLISNPRLPGDCRPGDLDSTTETRVRTEVWVR